MNEHEQIKKIPLAQLRAHEQNSNVMSEGLMAKLTKHVEATGNYPPLIVRSLGVDDETGQATYQMLDGHHRWRVLERLGRQEAACVVWDVDEAGALLLMATLNRLQGQDDPYQRATLLRELQDATQKRMSDLEKWLPENAMQLKKYLSLNRQTPVPIKPIDLDQMPVSIHFFLTGEQKKQLDQTLGRIDASRETALMRLVSLAESVHGQKEIANNDRGGK